jgi:AraC-like DNA-binding protein
MNVESIYQQLGEGGINAGMQKTYRREQLKFNDNLYFLIYKTWEERSPDGYYHEHEGIELLYIHEGTGRLILDNRLYLLKPRTLIFFQPHQVHFLQYESPRLRSIVKVNTAFLKPYLQLFPHLAGFVALLEKPRPDRQLFQLSPEQDRELTAQLSLIHDTVNAVPGKERKEHFVILWMQLMSFLKTRVFAQLDSQEKDAASRQSHHVQKIVAWIERHFREPFNLEKLSADIHLSASYISNLFRNYTGLTITEYILRRRLDEACILLTTTSLSVSRIGSLSGFPNPAYFSRCFKKRHQMTPQQYRASREIQNVSVMPNADENCGNNLC